MLQISGREPGDDPVLISAAHRRVVGVVRDLVALDHENINQAAGWIGPALGAERTAVAEGTGRKDFIGLHLLRIFHDAETESPRHAGAGAQFARLLARHLRNGLGLDDAFTGEFPAVQHHLIKLRDILRGGEQSRTAERRTRVIGDRPAVHVKDGRLFEFFGLGVEHVGVCAAFFLFGRNPPGGVLHAERIEDALLHEVGKRHPAHDFDHAAERVDARRRVTPSATRRETERLAGQDLAHGGEAPMGIGHGVFAETARVRGEIAERDRPRRLHEREMIGGLVLLEPETTKLRDVFLDRIVEAQLPFIGKERDAGDGHRLRHGRDPEDIVGAHLAPGREIALPDGGDMQDVIAIGQQHDGAGDFTLVDEGLNFFGHARETIRGGGGEESRGNGDEAGAEQGVTHDGEGEKLRLSS